ncbi:MAG: hypothetical protein JO202_10525 [Ktedonobacteraceae bacterium]|nr:hypothetical protein [Ktedonobacteraceae bacterium]
MRFNGTTDSLLPRAEDLDIHREREIVDLLIRYEQQLETPKQVADHTLLEYAQHLLEDRLAIQKVDEELAHLTVAIYYPLHQWRQVRQVLSQYRKQPLSLYEEGWARWCEIDCLAMERQYGTVVKLQQDLLQWAMQLLPADQCLFAMNDSSQALCWLMTGQQKEWLTIFENLMCHVTPAAANREDRFVYLRTAVYLLVRGGQSQEASPLLERLYQLVQEEPHGNEDMCIETYALHIKVASSLGETEQLRQVATKAWQQIQEWITTSKQPTLHHKRQLRRLCHNMAASLYQAHQYDLAIPLFEQAIDYGFLPPHAYMWLAASLWITTRDKRRVLTLIEQAGEHDASGELPQKIVELPELHDLLEDTQFQDTLHVLSKTCRGLPLTHRTGKRE